ncbi:hypothetical protein TNCV_3212851 [Trichonephila clavipes]|nr:hypothetical protein TNCV_3212851 [Trichonephila clavipes]
MINCSHDSSGLAIETSSHTPAFTSLRSCVDVMSRKGVGLNSERIKKKQFFPKLNASSGTMAQASKGSYLGKLPLWPIDPLYHCRDLRYGPEHKKSGYHSLGSTKQTAPLQVFCKVYATQTME